MRPKPRPTISDVARLARVSISTVSRVVNATAPVSEDVEQRVRSAIAMLGYTPHAAARNLAVRKTNTIGLLLPEMSSSFYTPLLRGIEAVVRRTDYDLLVYASARPNGNGAGDWRHRQPIGEHNVDGMLVFTTTLDESEIYQHYERGFPMVLLHRTPPRGVFVPSVMFDNRNGVMAIVRHLVDVHGRRRIAFMRGPAGNQDSDLREAALREALADLGIPYDPALVVRGGFHEASGEQAVYDLVASGARFDALFTGDDEAAAGALVGLRKAGLRVPQDVALVGFDDLPLSRHLNPPLTTVRAPIEQAGRLAASLLLQLLAGEVAEYETVLPVDLVIRQSCGCA
jgi:LacI family transcriptional regulator